MVTATSVTNAAAIPGLEELWAETLGDSRICVAVLDGPVDQSHPSLAAATLTRLETLVPGVADEGPASRHGTHVASVIFGQHDGPVKGIAPQCRSLIIPIFRDGAEGTLAPCSQLDLARAISQAVEQGAHVINISGGELTPSGTAHPLLADVVRNCTDQGVLIVAAAGNEGCACLHAPGALPSVLAVGAMNAQGEPLAFSNWGVQYQTQGILAHGQDILGASPGGGTVTNSGTSYATPIVSGIAALLLSLQRKRGQQPHPPAVRAALLSSALGCDDQQALDCRRVLAGRLNVKGAMSQIVQGETPMSDPIETQENVQASVTETASPEAAAIERPAPAVQAAAADGNGPGTTADLAPPSPAARPASQSSERDQGAVVPSRVRPADCSCGGGGPCTCGAAASAQLVYAIGQLGFDFGNEARRDSITQHMGDQDLQHYLDRNPWDAAAIIWTLNVDATPIYAIRPQGAFANEAYQQLREFLHEQLHHGVERISVPGVIAGQARLFSGQVVPVIYPDLRGMYSWTTDSLIEAVCGKAPGKGAKAEARAAYTEKAQAIANFLVRVYDELRNLGITPQERAINYAASNAFQVAGVFEDAIKEGMDLDTIEVERSPICRLDSDCWDVKLTFFNPRKVFEQARKEYRFTVDVSDVVPVMVGDVRSWFVR